MSEDGAYGRGVGEESGDAHVRAALGTAEGEGFVNACEELGPAGTSGGTGETVGGIGVAGGCETAAALGGLDVQVASEGDDVGRESGVGGQDSVVAVAVDPGWRDKAGEGVQKFERREGEVGAAVGGGPGRLVEHPAKGGVLSPSCRLAFDRCPAR
jgi:hypothetical protein